MALSADPVSAFNDLRWKAENFGVQIGNSAFAEMAAAAGGGFDPKDKESWGRKTYGDPPVDIKGWDKDPFGGEPCPCDKMFDAAQKGWGA